jgi:hypothetical protein
VIALARQHHRLDGLGQGLEAVLQGFDQGVAERIALGRAVDRDAGDRIMESET